MTVSEPNFFDAADAAAKELLSMVLRLAWLLGGVLTSDRPDLSLRTLRILYRLAERPARAGELASAAGVTAPSITVAVSTLEKQGWVRRRPDPTDGRARLIELTALGRTVLRDGERHLHLVLRTMTRDFDASLLEAIHLLRGPIDDGVDRVREELGRDPKGLPRVG